VESVTSAHGKPSAPPVIRLVSPDGVHEPATVDQAGQLANSAAFAWLDIENPTDDHLDQLGESLRLEAGTVQMLRQRDRRPTFTTTDDATYAAVLAAAPDGALASGLGDYVSAALTERFVLTLHATPCPALQLARDRYGALHKDSKADGSLTLFLILDTLLGSFEPDLLTLDEKLDRLQVKLLDDTPPGVQDDILATRRSLTGFLQGLNWYANDLESLAGTVDGLPGMRAGSEQRFDRHYFRVRRVRDAVKDYRDEATDALSQCASNTTDRQGQLINVLTVVSTLFLPLTFLTGFFGMNFGVIVHDLNSTWSFVLLGIVLPLASVAISYGLYLRLLRRFRVVGPGGSRVAGAPSS
jgi:magnesium transporter